MAELVSSYSPEQDLVKMFPIGSTLTSAITSGGFQFITVNFRARIPAGSDAFILEQLNKGIKVYTAPTLVLETEKVMADEVKRLEAENNELRRQIIMKDIVIDSLKAGLLPDALSK